VLALSGLGRLEIGVALTSVSSLITTLQKLRHSKTKDRAGKIRKAKSRVLYIASDRPRAKMFELLDHDARALVMEATSRMNGEAVT